MEFQQPKSITDNSQKLNWIFVAIVFISKNLPLQLSSARLLAFIFLYVFDREKNDFKKG